MRDHTGSEICNTFDGINQHPISISVSSSCHFMVKRGTGRSQEESGTEWDRGGTNVWNGWVEMFIMVEEIKSLLWNLNLTPQQQYDFGLDVQANSTQSMYVFHFRQIRSQKLLNQWQFFMSLSSFFTIKAKFLDFAQHEKTNDEYHTFQVSCETVNPDYKILKNKQLQKKMER